MQATGRSPLSVSWKRYFNFTHDWRRGIVQGERYQREWRRLLAATAEHPHIRG